MPNLAPAPIVVGRFRLVFDWRGDRFGHSILLAESTAGDSPARLLESIEGTPDEAWPASPVLQEFHCETRNDGHRVALLVGRAGKSHWSLSVLCDHEREELLFEAACRFGRPPLWLGSRYGADAPFEPLASPTHPAQSNAAPAVLLSREDGGLIRGSAGSDPTLANPTWRLQPLAADCTRPSQQVCSPDEFSPELSLAAPEPSAASGFRTVCWSYRIFAASKARHGG